MSQKVESKSVASTPIKADRRQSYQSERFVPDLLERGGPVRGEPQALNSRLFIQLQVFTGCFDTAPVVDSVRDSGLEVVVYANLNDARGIGILVMAEDPLVFSEAARSMFLSLPFRNLTPLPNFTMFGRTYATGREPDSHGRSRSRPVGPPHGTPPQRQGQLPASRYYLSRGSPCRANPSKGASSIMPPVRIRAITRNL